MTIWTCKTCGVEHPDSDSPPTACAICSDERQYVPEGGQLWTTRAELADQQYQVQIENREQHLYTLTVEPEVGIGHRSYLVQTPEGNLLFDPPGFIDDAAIEAVQRLGGVAVIASSHPHLTGSSIQWSHAFANAPVLVSEKDEQWIRRPDPVIQLWKDQRELLPQLTMIECGGHFAGSSVVHWPDGAEGRGALIAGDTIHIGADRMSVNVMRSFVNNIPLSERAVRRIMETTLPLRFDRLYGAFEEIDSDARPTIERSLSRYVAWLRDEVEE